MKRIRFLHIPKTAGTTFEHMLSRMYPGKLFIFSGILNQDFEKYAKLSQDEKEKISLFTGHAPLITGIQEIDNTPTITLLRDPVERVKSFCQHVREGKSPYLLERFPPEKFNLDAFLDSGNQELNNLHARNILGNRDFNLLEIPPRESVDQALALLQNYIVGFGIVEYFDESLLLFQKQFNWQWPFYLNLNIKDNTRILEFQDSHIEKIRNLNRIDIDIYQAACEIFENSLVTHSGFFDQNLSRFKRRQILFQKSVNLHPYAYKLFHKLFR
jgi:hypothetical protein